MANELINKFLSYCKNLKDGEEPKRLSEILGSEEDSRLFAKQLANGEYPNLAEARDGDKYPVLEVLATSLGKELEDEQTDGGRTYNPFADNAFMHRGITLRSMQRNLQELEHLTALQAIDRKIAARGFTGDVSADTEIEKGIDAEIANLESRYSKYNPVRYYRNFHLDRKKKKLKKIIKNDAKRLKKQNDLWSELETNQNLEETAATHGLFSKEGIKARSQLLWRKVRGKSTDRLQDKFTETMLLNDVNNKAAGSINSNLTEQIKTLTAARDSVDISKDQKKTCQLLIDSLTKFQSKIETRGKALSDGLATELHQIDTKYHPQTEELKVKITRNREYINDQNLELRLKTDFGKAYKEICKGLPGYAVTQLDARFNARTQKHFTDDKEFIKLCEEQLGEAEAKKLIQKLDGYLKPQNNSNVGGNGNNDNDPDKDPDKDPNANDNEQNKDKDNENNKTHTPSVTDDKDKDPNAPEQELEGFDRQKFYSDFAEKIKDRYDLPDGADKDNIGDQKHFEFQSKANDNKLELDTTDSGKVRFTAKDKDGNNVSPELADFAALVQSYKEQGYDKINLSANSSDEYNQKLMAALKLEGMKYDIIDKDGKPLDRDSDEFKKIDEGSQKLVDHEKNKDKPEVILEEGTNTNSSEKEDPFKQVGQILNKDDLNEAPNQQYKQEMSMVEKAKTMSKEDFAKWQQSEEYTRCFQDQDPARRIALSNINDVMNNSDLSDEQKQEQIKNNVEEYSSETARISLKNVLENENLSAEEKQRILAPYMGINPEMDEEIKNNIKETAQKPQGNEETSENQTPTTENTEDKPQETPKPENEAKEDKPQETTKPENETKEDKPQETTKPENSNSPKEESDNINKQEMDMLGQIRGLTPKQFEELEASGTFSSLPQQQKDLLFLINQRQNDAKMSDKQKSESIGRFVTTYMSNAQKQNSTRGTTKQRETIKQITSSIAAIKSKQGNSH